MLYKLGRALQVVGMIVLPVAMAGNLAPGQPVDSRLLLVLAFVGLGIFTLGWLLQQSNRPQ